jgi:hypothetical protein
MTNWKAAEEEITFDRGRSDQVSFTSEISDDALEALACPGNAPSPAASFEFSSYHLQCC